jgi:mono/diheme cytochrome c family protein
VKVNAKRGSAAIAALMGALVLASGTPSLADQDKVAEAPAALKQTMPDKYKAMLDKYCVTCHNEIDAKPAGKPLLLDDIDFDGVPGDADTWELVVRKLGVGAMPPPGKAHPDAAVLKSFRDWLVETLDAAAAREGNPGDYVIHRLNRTEYGNAVRDLFGVKVDTAAMLPPDSAEFGFDDIATALRTSAALLDRYVTAAERISTVVVGDAGAETSATIFPVRLDANQLGHVAGLPLGTRGGQMVHHDFPVDGEYELSASLFRPVDSSDRGIEGQQDPNEFTIVLDGKRVYSAMLGGPEDHNASIENFSAARESVAARMKKRLFVGAGPHDIGFTFVDRAAQDQDAIELSQRVSEDIHVAVGRPVLRSSSISGPYQHAGVSGNSYRQRLIACRPGGSQASQRACARRTLAKVAMRAYRRPTTDTDLSFIMPFYEEGYRDGGFDGGLRRALPRILTSPSFLFRFEHDPEQLAPGMAHAVTDLELASRLSFFLWSTIPDDELLATAIAGRLHEPQVLEKQVRRMLADRKATELTANFSDQWLGLRNLATFNPDLLGFPDWDGTLRDDLQRETQMFFDSVVRGNRSALDLIDADYSFVNERIAQYYGLKGVHGANFRRVPMPAERRGLLGQGSILALTSVATRTSPVFRGKWILSTLLDVPPGTPPPNVPALDEADTGAKTMRQRLEVHRKNEPCASCHRVMDPIGFTLENYDPTGRWRTRDAGQAVDASGVLLDGSAIDGPEQMRAWLRSHPDVFVGTLASKLMTYALGRGLTARDQPVVRSVVKRAAADNYRFEQIVLGIVESRPFLMRRKTPAAAAPALQASALQEH